MPPAEAVSSGLTPSDESKSKPSQDQMISGGNVARGKARAHMSLTCREASAPQWVTSAGHTAQFRFLLIVPCFERIAAQVVCRALGRHHLFHRGQLGGSCGDGSEIPAAFLEARMSNAFALLAGCIEGGPAPRPSFHTGGGWGERSLGVGPGRDTGWKLNHRWIECGDGFESI